MARWMLHRLALFNKHPSLQIKLCVIVPISTQELIYFVESEGKEKARARLSHDTETIDLHEFLSLKLHRGACIEPVIVWPCICDGG